MRVRHASLLIIAGMLMIQGQSAFASGDGNETPTPELLEFLGTYGDDKGKFLDPAELEKADIPEEKQNESKTEK